MAAAILLASLASRGIPRGSAVLANERRRAFALDLSSAGFQADRKGALSSSLQGLSTWSWHRGRNQPLRKSVLEGDGKWPILEELY